MSVKGDCGKHGFCKSGCNHRCRKSLYLRIFFIFVAFIISILFIILLVYLILRPTKPRFTLQDATVYQFNVSGSNFLTTNIQVTISSRNPNDKIGIYYDKLDIYVTYRSQQITLPTVLPSTYQGHKDINVWSPFVCGSSVPVAPYLCASLMQDQAAGMVLVNIKVSGRLRWKVGTWISGHYHISVNCPAYITFGSRNTGFPVGDAIKYQLVQQCSTDV